MKVSRKALIAASTAGAAAAYLRFPAEAAEFEYKWSENVPLDYPLHIRAEQATERIYRESNGRLRIRVYPNSILGSNQVEMVRLGAVEIGGTIAALLESSVPVTGLVQMPFAFSSYKQAWDTFDGPFGQALRTAISKTGLYPFARTFDAGFKNISNNVRPVYTPADLKGLKIRVQPSAMGVSTFKVLGAAPTPVSVDQMYTAAQTHLVDGTDLPLTSLESYRMYEVQKYVSITNHSYNAYWMSANPAAWQKLPPNIREIVERNMDAAAQLERADVAKLDITLEKKLQDRGMQVTEPDVAPFKAIIRSSGMYAQWKTQYGAEMFGLLERSVGTLT